MIEVCCRKCGKIFVPAPQHIYRDRYGYYCSWTCYNHRKEVAQKKKLTREIEQRNRAGEIIKVFKNAKQAADAVLGSEKNIYRACNSAAIYHGFVWRYHYDVP